MASFFVGCTLIFWADLDHAQTQQLDVLRQAQSAWQTKYAEQWGQQQVRQLLLLASKLLHSLACSNCIEHHCTDMISGRAMSHERGQTLCTLKAHPEWSILLIVDSASQWRMHVNGTQVGKLASRNSSVTVTYAKMARGKDRLVLESQPQELRNLAQHVFGAAFSDRNGNATQHRVTDELLQPVQLSVQVCTHECMPPEHFLHCGCSREMAPPGLPVQKVGGPAPPVLKIYYRWACPSKLTPF